MFIDLDCKMTNFKKTHYNEPFETCCPEFLYSLLTDKESNILVIDSRTFLEFNTCTVLGAVNICCSKLVKRRLQAGKISVFELLSASGQLNISQQRSVVLFDHCSESAETIFPDSFVAVLLKQLTLTFCKVYLLRGGFLGFHILYPHLCESKSNDGKSLAPMPASTVACSNGSTLNSLTDSGPTRILGHVLVGSEADALDIEGLKKNGVTHVLNVSANCARAPRTIIPDHAFLRIAINDDYSEKILPHLSTAFAFLEKCRESGGRCLVHCLAGISRSPTLAIAYVMSYLRLNSDDAYKFVKERRSSISPNFNFLGQLMDLESQLAIVEPTLATAPSSDSYRCQRAKRLRMRDSLSLFPSSSSSSSALVVASPTTALAQLSFGCVASAAAASVAVSGRMTTGAGALLSQFTGTSLEKVEYTACHASSDPVAASLAWPPSSLLFRNVSLMQQQAFTQFKCQASTTTTPTATASRRRTHQQTIFSSNGHRIRPLSAALAQTEDAHMLKEEVAGGHTSIFSSSISKAASLEDLVGMKVVPSPSTAAIAIQKSLCRLAGSSGSISSSGHSSSQHGSLEILQCY